MTRAAFRYKAYKRNPLALRFRPFGEGDMVSSQVFDVSTTGISFVMPAEKVKPHIGENIKLDFTLMDSARISCIGRVTRTQDCPGLNYPQIKVGVQFFELPVRYRLAIKKAIDRATAEDMRLLNSSLTMRADMAERRSTLLISRGASWDTSENDVLKIMLLFIVFGLGLYVLDQNSDALSRGKTSPPAWATKVFESRMPPSKD